MNILALVKGHYAAGLEHSALSNHKTTWLNAVHATVIDLIFYKVKTIEDSYIVYEIVNKPTINIKVALVTSIYVPKHKREQGLASKLLDKVACKPVICIGEEFEENKYRKLASAYVVREVV